MSGVAWFWLGIIMALSLACENALFKAPPQFKRGDAQQAVLGVDIKTHNLVRASPSRKGKGEVSVAVSEEATITCSDCPSFLPLRFTPRNNVSGDARLYVASFDHAYATETKRCRFNLEIKYQSGKTENKKYQVYFCPVDPATNKRLCNKEAAKSICS